ncbi:MAG: hypothetical protein ABIQ95_10375 [Bdellovibrionia bacterium]
MNKCGKNKLSTFLLQCGFCIFATCLSFRYALAATSTPLCFDFNVPVKAPLKTYNFGKSTNKDTTESGKLPDSKGGIWGSALGKVELPIQSIYQLLLDHYTIKNPEKVKLKVYPQERNGYQDFHVLMVTASAVVFKVNWEEEWAYKIIDGTSANPKKVVISYQKTTGTDYIPHLCGSIVLNSLGPKLTEVYLYEEVNALGKRSPQDTVKGHIGTLNTLRQQLTASKLTSQK